jgi:hypothetical protein
MQVHKQAVASTGMKTYGDIYRDFSKGGMTRLFTLGFIPSLIRNFILCAGFTPALMGYTYMPINLLYCTGAVVLSHPFEVARVII